MIMVHSIRKCIETS